MNTADIFVSYAHADDQPMVSGTDVGWVTQFADHLQKTLGMQAGGSRLKVWMDHRLAPQKSLDGGLQQRVMQAACFLAMLSPRYLESDWCTRELRWYLAREGVSAGDRVFIAETLPTDRARWCEAILGIVPSRFWTQPFHHRAPKTLGWPTPDLGDRAYWDELRELAYAIAERVAADEEAAAATRLRVWIGALGEAARARRDDLAASLRQYGCDVAPAEPWESAGSEAERLGALDAALDQADLLVHLLDGSAASGDGWRPLEAARAKARAAQRGLVYLSWREPREPGCTPGAPRGSFGGFEEFRQQVLATVVRLRAGPAAAPPAARELGPGAPLTICVSAERSDRMLGLRVTEMLDELGADSILAPEPDGAQPPSVWREQYETVVADTDALMLVYGQAPLLWVQSRLQAARKVIGSRRRGTWTALLDAPPLHKPELGLRMADLALIDCRHGLAQQLLAGFVDQLRAVPAGSEKRV